MTLTRSMFLGGAILLAVGALLLTFPDSVFAADAVVPATQTISTGLDAAATGSGYSKDLTLTVFIGNMIKTLLAATGIIFLVITVYAGILYMTAQGDESKVKKGKSMLTSAIIGLIIVVGAYAITKFVIDAFLDATSTTETEESQPVSA